ncbi:MAG: TM2 domain-containing protein [Oscillospiraceae bacterium]|nr:TM2 domain-containing protein [Oscillospiraceae bacterium]
MGFNRKLKNRSVSIFLCALFGIFGAHRFYEGKIFTGILWALTGGLGFIGWIIDLIILINKPKYYEP